MAHARPALTSCMADLIALESHTLREMSLNSIQIERTVAMFAQRIDKLFAARETLEVRAGRIRAAMDEHAAASTLANMPPELDAYTACLRPFRGIIDPTLEAREVSVMLRGMALPAKEARVPQNLEFLNCIRDGVVVSSMVPRAVRASKGGRFRQVEWEAHRCAGFLPILEGEAVVRRPASHLLAVCESNAPGMGRCLVSKTIFAAGDLLLVEHPFLTMILDPSKVALPQTYADTLSRIVGQATLLESRGWDMRLAVALLGYLSEVHLSPIGGFVRSALNNLACPLECLDSGRLTSLCEYAHFVFTALATSVQKTVSEDDIVGFFVSFQSNAISHGGKHFDHFEVDTVAVCSDEEKRSLFAFASLIEHSCDPNASVVMRSDTDAQSGEYTLELRALRDIGIGESISIAYCNLLPPTASRRKTLAARYYFDCMCPRCTCEHDVSRRLINASNEKATAVGPGGTWTIGGETVRANDSRIVSLLRAESRFLDASTAAGASGVTGWQQLLGEWVASYEDGFVRLAPEHYGVVTAACVCMRLGRAATPDVMTYTRALLGSVLGTKAGGWLEDVPLSEIANAAASVWEGVNTVVATACLLPVLETLATTALESNTKGRAWLVVYMILQRVLNAGSSLRAINAQIQAGDLTAP